ncbi:hypothetical protein AWM70_16885 [Paenibacillus yonginensis]|uniref:Glycosyltransferase 2-like domain-containing protein n=2 Tax=Paenibacillus yonginensis TaxID=1462996 RepID=A0A1B1N7A9_9BACL|nr:hypothetical protein AWM70_16885 [Paenibacillus yonginensis]
MFVSIILPVYNRQETITRAIESVLNQTFPHFELIVVDDASTDATSEVIKRFDDDRIRLIKLAENLGANAARNVGIKEAKAEWVAFHDSDDVWMPQKLEKQVTLAIQERAGSASIIYTSFLRFKSGETEYIPAKTGQEKQGNIHNQLLLGNFISTQTIMLKKEQLEAVGYFDETMPRFQDWEIALRLSRQYEFLWLDEPLVHVFYSNESISADNNKLLQAYEIIFQKHRDMFEIAGSYYLANLLFSYGHNLLLVGGYKKGRKLLFLSLLHRFSMKSLISLLCSFLGHRTYKRLYRYFNTIK